MRRRTGILRSEGRALRAFHAPLDVKLEEGRPAALWRALFYHSVTDDIVDTLLFLDSLGARHPGGHLKVCSALGLSPEEEEHEAPRFALNYVGLTFAQILPGEPSKGQWTFPVRQDEPRAVAALILPVGGRGLQVGESECLALLGAHDLARESAPRDIGDLVAIPLEGGRALSFNGTTAAVGDLFSGRETLRIATDGVAWLKRHCARAIKLREELPARLVARRLSLPDRFEVLMLDERAFCWRLEQNAAFAVSGIKQVICSDSAEVTDFIADELRRREPRKPLPAIKVKGPKA